MYEQLENMFHTFGQAYGYEWMSAGVIIVFMIFVIWISTRDISDPRYKK
jgi:hypothetical protein